MSKKIIYLSLLLVLGLFLVNACQPIGSSLRDANTLSLQQCSNAPDTLFIPDGFETSVDGNTVTLISNDGDAAVATCGCPSGCNSAECSISAEGRGIICSGRCVGTHCSGCTWSIARDNR